MWGQLAGAALGAIGGSKSQSSGGTPRYVSKQLKRGYAGLNAAADRPASAAIAPLNADQTRGLDMVRGNVGLGAGTIQEAIDRYRSAGAGVTPDSIERFMNPFVSEVIDPAVSDIERSRDRALLGINAQAEAAGAFGGDREAVAKALAAEDYNRNIASTVGGLRFGGWNSALDAAFRDNAVVQSGATGLIDAVGRQRGNAYQDAAALIGAGDTVRAYDQSLLDYPLKMAQMQIDAGAAGAGASRPQSSGGGVSGAIAGAGGGYDLFSQLFGP